MIGLLLAIDERDALRATQRHQGAEGDFGGISGAGKHGLAKYRAAYSRAIQAANELRIAPHFNAVRMAYAVQRGVGRLHLRQDPCAALAISWRICAGRNHGCKIMVNANLAARRGEKGSQGFAQTAVQLEILRPQHHARIGAPPKNRLACAVPREDALAVGCNQGSCAQIRPRRQQPWGRVILPPSLHHGRKRLALLKPS